MPADTCANEEAIVSENVFQNLAKLRIHALGRKPYGLIEKLKKW